VELPIERFASAVEAVLGPEDALSAELHASDLFLAQACLAADPAAIAIFEHDVMRAVRPSVERACRDGIVAPDDVIQGTLEKLLVGGPEAPKLAQYTGRGPLVGWVRVVAVREALQSRRKSKRQRAHEEEAVDVDDALPPLPMELRLLRERHHESLRVAVKRAVTELPVDQRALLRFSALDGLTIDQIAPLLGIHRATVARRLEKARSAVLDRTRAILRSEYRLSESEARSLCLALGAEVDASIGVALGGAGQ
jgi:RNA polymerase sigma-70 factor (ECF subfamily)